MQRTNNIPYCINLWAGPGVGKSTTAAGLFNLMKHRGYKVELVKECAKFFTYEGNHSALRDQCLLMCQQEYSQRIVRDHVDYIITDSPPAQGMAYASSEDKALLIQMSQHFRKRYGNLDVLLGRNPEKQYQRYGRNENEMQAIEMHTKVTQLFNFVTVGSSVDHMQCVADESAVEKIFNRMVMGNG